MADLNDKDREILSFVVDPQEERHLKGFVPHCDSINISHNFRSLFQTLAVWGVGFELCVCAVF